MSYSTVENMGIVAIGLGVGGAGVWAAVFHVVCHTFIKSSLFLQIAIVRQVYNGYRINRLGDYININKVGAIAIMVGMVAVLAFPPSPLGADDYGRGSGGRRLVAHSNYGGVALHCYLHHLPPLHKALLSA